MVAGPHDDARPSHAKTKGPLTRVLVVSQAPGVGGGERTVIPPLARAETLDVTVAGHPAVTEFARSEGLSATECALPWINRYGQLPQLLSGVRRVARITRERNPGIVYANGSRAFPYCIGAKLLTGRPLLAHHHGHFTTGPISSLVKGLERWADLIVIPSHSVADVFSPKARLRLIRYGIDLNRFTPAASKDEAKQAWDIPAEAPVAGIVSRADPTKGMDAFVEAAGRLLKEVPNIRFLLVGGAVFPHEEAAYVSTSRRALETLGDRVTITGHIDDPERAFQAMDVFLHLSTPEGLPTTAIESLACGVPVVGYKWGGLAEIVDDEVGALVGPAQIEDAADATRDLLIDRSMWTAKSDAALTRARERYEISRYVQELQDAVMSVSG